MNRIPLVSLVALAFLAARAGADSAATDPHAAVLAESLYPAAAQCATCHPGQYDEWRYSSHAYASISPMFHKFEQAISDLSQGTVGYFCMRCHSGVGTTLGEPRELELWKRSRVAREGVTCVTCHRVEESYGKVNGERRILPGDIHQPVYGGIGGEGVREVVTNREAYNVATAPDQFGLKMHRQGIRFPQLAKSEFCVSCHQVAVHPGIKLETVWDEYRASPAIQAGITCQDCHMSTSPGQNSGFARGPAAIVNGKVVNPDRQRSNHAFIGPGYPITHPGIFPHHPEGARFPDQAWLRFDYRAGWGTDGFEAEVAAGKRQATFPAEWQSAEDRVEARLIVDDNLKKVAEKAELRRQLMENSSHLDGPFFASPPRAGRALHFHYRVSNRNNGHNMPSGSLGAQPEIWLNVALIDPDGKNVWESGYVDSHGDMADLHSLDVAQGKIAHDGQLFNLQSKFLTTNVKGTDREMYLPVPFDPDQIPFIRPAGTPNSVLNHPPFIRMEKRSLPPLGSREASYTVPAGKIDRPGTWRLAARLLSRAEPIYFMSFVGATDDMKRAMNEWMLDIHPSTIQFEVQPSQAAEVAAGVTQMEQVEHDPGVFRPNPAVAEKPYDPAAQEAIYGGKKPVKTARPLLEWGRDLYDRGAYSPSPKWFGEKNPAAPQLLVYGDLRVAAAYNDTGSDQSTVAARLNLDLDWKLTATERLHAFIRPFDKDGSFLRYDLGGRNQGFESRFDGNLETLFFEGDWGQMLNGWTGREHTLDLPFTLGMVPLFTQNGIWLDDAFLGFALSPVSAKSSRALDISNLDLTFFAGLDKVTTGAAPGDDVRVYGLAGFAEANRGYWEFGYGYVDPRDPVANGLAYHNATVAFTRRYGGKVSNSVRVIGNFGQDPAPGQLKTADGALLLIENSLISSKPLTFLPYFNLFAGFDRPQPLARAAGGGGVLKNTGINFESDALTGYPTLNDTGHDSWGGAVGVEYLWNLDRQIVIEAAAVQPRRSRLEDGAAGEYALGLRFQQPLNNAWILRADAMHGWRQDLDNVFGVRLEIRRKF